MTPTRTQPASRKQALAPHEATLDERSIRAWTERMAVRRLPDGRYAVDGESDATYVVDLERAECTCPDHQIRGERCKHIRRVAIEINLGRVLPPGTRAVDCAACGDSIVVDEDDTPPYLCESCHVEPGSVVVDRETGDTLRVVAVRDRRADEVEIPELGVTVADHPSNEKYDRDDPVVDVTYPGSGERTYSFPLSRLRAERANDYTQLTLSHRPEPA